MCDKPLKGNVNIVFLLARDRVTAYFSILNGAQVHFLDKFLFIQGPRQVSLIAENEDGNAGELGLVEQILQLVSRRFQLLVICGVDHVDDAVDAAAIALPHGPEARLAADVPQLYRHVAFHDFAHVEPNRRNHVFAELTRRCGIEWGRKMSRSYFTRRRLSPLVRRRVNTALGFESFSYR